MAGAGPAGAAGVVGRPVSGPRQCTNPSDTVMAIRVATNSRERVIKVGQGGFPDAIAITPNGKTAYVAVFGNDEVLPISTRTAPLLTRSNNACFLASVSASPMVAI